MRSGIIRRGDVQVLGAGVIDGLVQVADLDEHLQDAAEEVDGGLDLGLGVCGLDGGGHDGDVEAIGADLVRGGDHGNVDV